MTNIPEMDVALGLQAQNNKFSWYKIFLSNDSCCFILPKSVKTIMDSSNFGKRCI